MSSILLSVNKNHSDKLSLSPKWLELGHLFLALLFLTAMTGAIYGSGDDMFIIPGVYKIENPELYPYDMGFPSEQGTIYYHAFGQYLLFILSRWLPIEYCIFFFITFWRFCLVVGMNRLASRIAGAKISALTIATLIFFNPHLVGYYLTGNFYAIHFAALALSILSLSYWISGQKISSIGLWVMAVLFHPLIGAGSLIFFIGTYIYRFKLLNIIFVSALIIIGLGIIEFGGINLLNRLAPEVSWTEVARIKVFVRGPWHLSPKYWGKWEIINFLIVVFFLVSSAKVWKETIIRMISVCGIFGGIFIAAGIFNNIFFLEPFFVLLNPFEIGPIVLAVAYLLSARFLFEMVQKKYYFSSLAVILCLSLQAWSIFLIIWVLKVFFSKYSLQTHPWIKDWLLFSLVCVAIAVQFELWGRAWVGDVSSTLIQQRAYVFLFASIGFFILCCFRKLNWKSWVYAVSIGFLVSAAVKGQIEWFELKQPWVKDWKEVCEFSLQNSPIESTFVIPPEIESFQYLSRRSAFFSFKHFPTNLNQISEWYSRMQVLGLISPHLDPKTLRSPAEINYANYNRLVTEDFLKIRKQYTFIDYCIVRQEIHLSLPQVFSNTSYKIYRIPDY